MGSKTFVSLVIDKQPFIKGSEEARKSLENLSRDIRAKVSSKSRQKNYNTSFDVKGDFQPLLLQKRLIQALDESLYEWGKKTSALGKGYFQEVVKSAPNRVKPRPGRIQTGLMLRSVQGRTKETRNQLSINVGWKAAGTGNYYRYFSFQEDGTRDVSPMRAIPKTGAYLSKQFSSTFGKELKKRTDLIR